jgi:tripartite-type tricarboxylate transporter receptor subunit TctC
MRSRALLFGAIANTVFWMLSAVAVAQDNYPSRPVSIVVAFPPGGVVDLHARAFAPALERYLKQPVVIVNKAGAAGGVGAQTVAVAKPDGYTLLMSTNSMTILPEVFLVTKKTPLFTRDQFTPLGRLSVDPPLLVVSGNDPWNTVVELLAEAKSNPGKISYGSAGVYSAPHLAMHLLTNAANVQLWHVPYAGSPPALSAVLGGHVRMSAAPPSIVGSHVKSGAVRALATWGKARNPAYPDVPTLAEAGVNTDFDMWTGVFVLREVPGPIVERLRTVFRQASEAPDVQKALANFGTTSDFLDGPQFSVSLDRENSTMAAAVKSIGVVDQR